MRGMTPRARLLCSRLAVLVFACGACGGGADGSATGSGSATAATTTATGGDVPTTTDPGAPTSGAGSVGDPTTDPSSTTTTSGSATTGTTGDATGIGGTTDPGCFGACSDDLKAVMCGEAVLETCGEGSYCVDGACATLTPCQAAALFKTSEGCEFFALKSQLIVEAGGACFAAFVANTSAQPVKLAVEYDGQALDVAAFTRVPQGQGKAIMYLPYDADLGLGVDEVAILSLARGPGDFPDCPAPPAIDQEVHILGTGRGQAFRITSDGPVAAYQVLPYGGGSVAVTSATLMLPTAVWDTNYIIANAYALSMAAPGSSPLFSVVAREDDTKVILDPKVAVVGGDFVDGGPAGVPIEYTLDAGQALQIAQPEELTGSTLTSSRPVAVFGGNSCMNIPVDHISCDGAHQQIPPIKALGSAYAAVRYRNRIETLEEEVPWRLIGAVDGTQLSYVPAKPPGAPDVLDLGELAEFTSPGPFLVQSQDGEHPFYLGAYMTGGQEYEQFGDPEWVNVIPTAQFLDRYVLFTDPTYPDTSLVVVRNRKDGAFAPVDLDCAGELGGWNALGDDQEWTRIDLVKGNFEDQGACSNGRHEMHSANPFGVTVWGWGTDVTFPYQSLAVSYAYPAGASFRAINDVVVPPG